MHRLSLFCCVIALLISSNIPAESIADEPTTVIVIRHAEKADDDPVDPTLSPDGQARARTLVGALADARVAAIYSTQFRRTRETVAPLARHFGLEVKLQEVESGQVTRYAEELAETIRNRHAGKTVVVVGHSNTVPQIVEALSGIAVEPISECDYDHFFTVIIPPDRPARLVRSRYGAASAAIEGQL